MSKAATSKIFLKKSSVLDGMETSQRGIKIMICCALNALQILFKEPEKMKLAAKFTISTILDPISTFLWA